MAGISGWLDNDTDYTQLRIVRRSEELDALLRANGYDADAINVVQNPLVGACESARISVLVHPISDTFAGTTSNAIATLTGNEPLKWTLYLSEQGGTTERGLVQLPADAASLPQPQLAIINNPGIPNPIRDESVNPPEEAAPQAETAPPIVQDVPMNEQERDYGAMRQPVGAQILRSRDDLSTRSAESMSMLSTLTGGTNAVETPLGAPRAMVFAGLICTSIRELRRSGAASSAVNLSGRPQQNDTLFVMELTDVRSMLRGIRSLEFRSDLIHDGITSSGAITDSTNNTNQQQYYGGMALGCVNMLADPPVAFEANTVAATVTYPPALLDFPGFSDPSYVQSETTAPSWKVSLNSPINTRHLTNTAAALTHIQRPYSRDEILRALAAQVLFATNGVLQLDLAFYDAQLGKPAGAAAFDDGDIVNLDFRGMNLGEALDTFAQRHGCVWLYDARSLSLVLSLARAHGTQTAGTVPNLPNWLSSMADYRVAGYINTMTLDLPQTVVVSHEAFYCSRLGPERSEAYSIPWLAPVGYGASASVHTYAHLIDCRSHETTDGVISTRFVNGLNGRTPTLWHTDVAGPTHTTVEIRDHIPAMIGHSTPNGLVPAFLPGTNHNAATGGSFVNGPEYWLSVGGPKGLGNTNTRVDKYISPDPVVDYEVPWNYTSGLLRTAIKSLDPNTITPTPTDAGMVFDYSFAERFDMTLKGRRELLKARMDYLRQVSDGEAVFTRMPDPMAQGRLSQITPSVGLQYETIRFGTIGIPSVEYRIRGRNNHPLLYPQGAKVEAHTSGAGVTAAMVGGVKHTSLRRTERSNVVRIFMARVIGVQQAFTEDPTTVLEQRFYMNRYFFVEAAPDANPFTMYWSSGSALGYKGLCAGVAFNLYEQWFNPNPQTGTTLQWPHSVGGMPFNWDFGPAGDEPIRRPYTPKLDIVPVYEVTNRLGFTSYWIAVQPDVEVRCAPAPAGGFAPLTAPTWPYMGASGAAKATDSELAGIIETA